MADQRGMDMLRDVLSNYGMGDFAEEAWALYTDPSGDCFMDVAAVGRALRSHPQWLDGPLSGGLLPQDGAAPQ